MDMEVLLIVPELSYFLHIMMIHEVHEDRALPGCFTAIILFMPSGSVVFIGSCPDSFSSESFHGFAKATEFSCLSPTPVAFSIFDNGPGFGDGVSVSSFSVVVGLTLVSFRLLFFNLESNRFEIPVLLSSTVRLKNSTESQVLAIVEPIRDRAL